MSSVKTSVNGEHEAPSSLRYSPRPLRKQHQFIYRILLSISTSNNCKIILSNQLVGALSSEYSSISSDSTSREKRSPDDGGPPYGPPPHGPHPPGPPPSGPPPSGPPPEDMMDQLAEGSSNLEESRSKRSAQNMPMPGGMGDMGAGMGASMGASMGGGAGGGMGGGGSRLRNKRAAESPMEGRMYDMGDDVPNRPSQVRSRRAAENPIPGMGGGMEGGVSMGVNFGAGAKAGAGSSGT